MKLLTSTRAHLEELGLHLTRPLAGGQGQLCGLAGAVCGWVRAAMWLGRGHDV